MGNFALSRLATHAPVMRTVSLPRGRHRLHAMPTSCGYEIRADPAYHWHGLRRGKTPFTVLQYTVAGTGNLVHDRRRYRLHPGDTMLVIVPHNHRYWVEPGDRWEFFWISLTGQEAVRIHRTILGISGPVLHLREETVERLAGCALRLVEGEGETPGAASALAYEATMLLYDDVLGPDQRSGEEARNQPIRRTVDYIRANLDKPLDVGVLADFAGLSRSHFTRRFAAREGQPPAEFVMHERMRRAIRLLVAGELSVKDVGAACGFEDPNYFAKAFRRTFGTSPTEFRTTGMYAAQRPQEGGR